MRIVAILGGLVLGLAGLFLSVCGGGFLVSMGYEALRNLFGAHRDPTALIGLVLALSAGFLALGIVWCRAAYQILRKNLDGK